MTPLGWSLLAVAALAAAADWWAVWNDSAQGRRVERVAKPAVMVALIALAAVTPAATPAVRPWLVAALVLGLVGDVLLLPPGVFAGGLAAFLLGQLAYLAAFVHLPLSMPAAGVGVLAAIALIALVGWRIVRAARPAGLHLPVGVYLAAICAMAVAATATLLPALAFGAWLFVASDTMLGWGEFVTAGATGGRSRGGPRLRLAVIATYHVAQALLTVGLLSA